MPGDDEEDDDDDDEAQGPLPPGPDQAKPKQMPQGLPSIEHHACNDVARAMRVKHSTSTLRIVCQGLV